VETLKLSAILNLTGFNVTHVSIITSDISNDPFDSSLTTYRTFCYPYFLFFLISRRFGELLKPRYIFGAIGLDQ